MFSSSVEKFVLFIIIVTLLLIFLTVIISYLIYRYQKRQWLNKQKLDELQIQHENNILKSQIQVQEQTFQNISREIHDNIGQKLSLAKLQLNTIQSVPPGSVLQTIQNVATTISACIDDLRDISRSLSSEVIIHNGFLKALEFEIEQINKTFQYNISLKVTGESVIVKAEKELTIFRIIQEALHNIFKHAEATQIEIHVYFSNDDLDVMIIDNGKGFDLALNSDKNGLNNIKNRAISINGTVRIESTLKKGTIVHLKTPLHEPV